MCMACEMDNQRQMQQAYVAWLAAREAEKAKAADGDQPAADAEPVPAPAAAS